MSFVTLIISNIVWHVDKLAWVNSTSVYMILTMPITLLRIWQSWISVWNCFNFPVLWTGRYLFCNSIVHSSSWILVWKLSETFFLYVLNMITHGLAEFVGGSKHFDRCNKDSSCGHHPRQREKLKPCCGHRPGDPQHSFGNQLILISSLWKSSILLTSAYIVKILRVKTLFRGVQE